LKRLLPFLVFISFSAYGQMDTSLLPTVDLTSESFNPAVGSKTVQLDSALQSGYLQLSQSIHIALPVFVKSYGPSAIATFSVRGTGAQHTDVLWNGLTLNSPMLGLYDLNLVAPSAFEEIDFHYGGASMVSGASSFGGALNLKNELDWEEHMKVGADVLFGSYQTSHTGVQLSASNGRLVWRTKLLWDRSLNDFEFTDPRNNESPTYINEHAEVSQNQWIQEVGYRVNENNKLIARLWIQQSNRKLPSLLTLYSDPDPEGRSVQKDVQQRGQLEWSFSKNRFQSVVRSGLSSWQIQFNDDKSTASAWQNQWKTIYQANHNMQWSSILQVDREAGRTEAYKNQTVNRWRYGLAIEGARNISDHRIEVQAKQERVGEVWAPLQFQLGGELNYGTSKLWQTKLRFGKQVRFATLNDLFWGVEESLSLEPEENQQAEIGQYYQKSFGAARLELSATLYSQLIDQYILWLPQNDNSWKADNVEKVEILGSEVTVRLQRQWKKWSGLITGSYGYTQSEDPAGDQLIFIPKHQFRGRVQAEYESWVAMVSFVHQGKVYTDSENDFYMPWYQTADVRISYRWSLANHEFSSFVQSSNVTNREYQSLPYRPMPGRTFQIGLKWTGKKTI